ncbi:MAG: hypothetical protein CMK09_10685 [Ponticaulis sp.]|nr:hypothetical protein [Ponticaulis sp.]|tara:strand:- start:38828 stop:39535 length:708 start_codon:yes stop_codon:yes gene_type:complete
MLLSWKYKFLFIHVAKTGGTALTEALAPFARREDQIAHIGGRIPLVNRMLELWSGDQNMIEKVTGFDAHVRYHELTHRFGEDRFADLFKFAFVRNPFSRTYSLYSHITRSPEHRWFELVKQKRFEEMLPLMIEEDWITQAPFFCAWESLESGMDFIGAFERMDADVDLIVDRLGLEKKIRLKRRNVDPKPMPELRAQYGDQLDMFLDATRAEFELFGYSTDVDRAHEPPNGVGLR